VRSLQIPEGNPLLVHFGGKDVRVFEGVASLWFEEAGAFAAFRAYREDLEKRSSQAPFFTSSEFLFLNGARSAHHLICVHSQGRT
jgi:hypothetical protein